MRRRYTVLKSRTCSRIIYSGFVRDQKGSPGRCRCDKITVMRGSQQTLSGQGCTGISLPWPEKSARFNIIVKLPRRIKHPSFISIPQITSTVTMGFTDFVNDSGLARKPHSQCFCVSIADHNRSPRELDSDQILRCWVSHTVFLLASLPSPFMMRIIGPCL